MPLLSGGGCHDAEADRRLFERRSLSRFVENLEVAKDHAPMTSAPASR
jgi:hypothetical protein